MRYSITELWIKTSHVLQLERLAAPMPMPNKFLFEVDTVGYHVEMSASFMLIILILILMLILMCRNDSIWDKLVFWSVR